jgi:hypothetical protein
MLCLYVCSNCLLNSNATISCRNLFCGFPVRSKYVRHSLIDTSSRQSPSDSASRSPASSPMRSSMVRTVRIEAPSSAGKGGPDGTEPAPGAEAEALQELLVSHGIIIPPSSASADKQLAEGISAAAMVGSSLEIPPSFQQIVVHLPTETVAVTGTKMQTNQAPVTPHRQSRLQTPAQAQSQIPTQSQPPSSPAAKTATEESPQRTSRKSIAFVGEKEFSMVDPFSIGSLELFSEVDTAAPSFVSGGLSLSPRPPSRIKSSAADSSPRLKS